MKPVPWTVVFAGISAVAGIAFLFKSTGGNAGSYNIFPALNEQGLSGPDVPAYNTPELASPVGTGIPSTQPNPNYLTYNQGPNRVASKAAQFLSKMRSKACGDCGDGCGCFNPCKSAANGTGAAMPSVASQTLNQASSWTNPTNYTITADATLL